MESKMNRGHYLLYLLTVFFSWDQSVRGQEYMVTIEASPDRESYAVGENLNLSCVINPQPVFINWIPPGGREIIDNSRVIIHPTNSDDSNYNSILQFTYLMEGDEGNYTCNWRISEETSGSQSFVLQLLTIPAPIVNVTSLNNQIVGQSITLQCKVTTVRGITSSVDIVWSSGDTELQRMNSVSSTTVNNSLVYTDTYNIAQLVTIDDGRMIHCEVVINTNPPVITSGDIILDVTGFIPLLNGDGGEHTCLVSVDGFDEANTSDSVLIAVNAPTVTVTLSPSAITDSAKDSAINLTCTATVVPDIMSAEYLFTWIFNDAPINESDGPVNIFTSESNIQSVLLIYSNDSIPEYSGIYTCQVTLVVFAADRFTASDTSYVVLTVPPTIITPMEGQQFNILEGNNVSITCTATGYPVPTVVWQNSDGSSLSNDRLLSGSPVISSPDVTSVSVELMVIGVMRVDTGMYRCSANNSDGNATNNINITVLSPPTIITPMEGQQFNIIEGNNGSITCTATGYPVPTVVWQNSDGSSLSNNRLVSGSPVISSTGVGNVISVTVELMVLGAMRADTGMYRCLANNSVGSTTKYINITVLLLSLQENAQSINILEGQSVTLSCVPKPDDLMVNWTRRGVVIDSSDDVTLSPENLQHVLTIRNADISDSGDYVCYIVDFPLLINRTIRLNVLQACQQDYIGGILWNRHMINQVARIRCSAFHSSFRPGVYITRMCNNNGEWGSVDYSSCAMRLEAAPLILVEVKDPGSSANATSVVNQVISSVLRTNYTVLKTTHQFYEIFPSNILVIFVEINSISVPENIIANLIDVLRGLSFETSITGFQPSFQCSCTDVVMRSTLNYICYGPSVAPCTLLINGSYQCTENVYSGNGILCGVDSDSDGFPDGQLDCTDQRCEQDECPYTFSESTNSPTLCSPVSGIGCQPENDTVWGIGWHFTTAGSVAQGKCPGLSESSGLAYRICLQDAMWDTFINVTQCQSIELMVLSNILDENQDILANNLNNETRDMTVLFDIREVEAISVDVSNLTNVSTAIVPNDIHATNNIVNSLIRITETVVETDISAETAESLESIVKSTSSTIDNLLASSNAVSFEESNNMQLPVAEDLLRNTEKLAIVIGDVLKVTSENISDSNATIIGDNIVFNAQLAPENTELINDIIFPEVGDTQVIIPANAIIHQRATERIRVPVVNFIAQNLQSYLNNQTISEGFSTTSSGMIISSQISKSFIQLPENGTVQLKFNSIDIIGEVFTTLCVFWDFNENNQTMGGWSSEGIIQDNNTTPPILCNTTHLTSFSVLVSSNEESFETAAELHVTSYVGCGISVFSLLLTITAIVTLRKAAFKAQHNKIHLNLSIALLLGLIVFISGIETAKDDKIGCIIVATLLHYFFLAVFCWALCEGIIIYVLFVKVFYQGIFQQIYFYLLLGWGLPIPIVGISVGLSYNKYGIKDENGQRMTCWISDESGANWAFTAPMIVIILINIVLLIASLCKIYQTRKNYLALTNAQKSNYNIAKTLIWSIFALLPLLCGTWILGLLFLVESESEVFAWIFTIINTLQGFAIFFFHVVRNKEVSNEIKERFKKWRNRQLLKSSFKDSALDRNQKNDNFMLKNKDTTIESSKKDDALQNFGSHKPVNFISVDDVAFVSDDELAILTSKDFLQNDELY